MSNPSQSHFLTNLGWDHSSWSFLAEGRCTYGLRRSILLEAKPSLESMITEVSFFNMAIQQLDHDRNALHIITVM